MPKPPNVAINSHYYSSPILQRLTAVESSMRRVSSRQRLVSWDAFDATHGDDADLSDLSEVDPDILEGIFTTTTETEEPLAGRKRSRHSEHQPVLIPSFSWEVDTTLATLCQDAQLLILSFLDETALRRLAACNCSFRSLILSTPGTKEVIWMPHLMRHWPVEIPEAAFWTLQDRLGLPTAAITTSGQNQPNIPLLLSMTPPSLPTQVDGSLLNHTRTRQQTSRRTTRHLMQAQESTSTHLQLVDGHTTVVAYTGPIGSGDRCVRANHPLPRPTIIHGNRSWTGSHKSALLNSFRAHPTPAPGVHSASGSLLSLLRHGARNIRGGMEHYRPFCAPYYQQDGTLNVTPRIVAYFEVEILQKEKSGDERADDDAVVVPPRATTSECVAVGLATEAFRIHSRMPGWDSLSFGYHGDDGGTFHSSGAMNAQFGPAFGAGDTVGCGIDYVARGIFFTLNGRFLGYGWKNLAPELLNHDLYPVVGIDTSAPIQLNFGTCKPFLYDLDDFHASHERIIQPRYRFSAPVIDNRSSRSGTFLRRQSSQKSWSSHCSTTSSSQSLRFSSRK